MAAGGLESIRRLDVVEVYESYWLDSLVVFVTG
ncbi:hypothetical protein EYZ11_009270 [Aspergillus tanneri]|uniref:Uncharacterized protein n=1 Tax=Aspergillus tanneri TaxID=1220188 RepID=A0A4S3J8I6_9EURO|nr:hypothetical protein EYZ11_009270 [Aspergillus tanneri]